MFSSAAMFGRAGSGINLCLRNIDKKYKPQIASLMTPRFQVFENDQIVAV